MAACISRPARSSGSTSRDCRRRLPMILADSKPVQGLDEMTQAAVVAFVELKGDARQGDELVVLALFRGCLDGLDFAIGDEGGEILVQSLDDRFGGLVLEA